MTLPRELGEFVVERRIGKGAMGEVHLARDRLLDRFVALKFAADDLGPEVQRRFIIEAQAAARVTHPNVAQVYRVGDFAGRPYIVAEWIEGTPLDQLGMPVGVGEALRLATGIARGLAAAHRRGVVHRDLKSSNVLLTGDGTPKIIDFGLAKLSMGAAAARPAQGPPGGSSARAATLAPAAVVRMPTPRDRTVAPAGFTALSAAPKSSDGTSARDRTVAPALRNVTRPGAVMGTPDYLAPEGWDGAPPTPALDVYALGALLFELLTGSTPFFDVPVERLAGHVRVREAPRVRSRSGGVDARIDDFVARCLSRVPGARFPDGSAVLAGLEALEGALRQEVPAGNPYRGLLTFEAAHRGVFFGREPEIEEIANKIARQPFVLVTGDSGVGKSSVCRAGVLPACMAGGLGGDRKFSTVTVVPGRRPTASLAASLAGLAGMEGPEFEALARFDPQAATACLLSELGVERGVVCFVDQLEELATLAEPGERRAADELLGWLVRDLPQIKLLATVRADYLTRLTRLEHLGGRIPDALYLLTPLSRERLRSVVVRPAERKGVRFESGGLVDAIVEAAGATEGGLPLLQFALARLWDARDAERGLITEAALRRLGGVSGALAMHADAVIRGLLPGHRCYAREVLTQLASADGHRRIRPRRELEGGDRLKETVLDVLIAARLVVVRSEDSQCTLTHEVLVTGWDTLRRWLVEDERANLVRARLVASVAEWRRLGSRASNLWNERQLREAEAMSALTLTPDEVGFIAASRRAVRWRRWRRLVLAVAVPVVLGAGYSGAQAVDGRKRRARIDREVTEGTAFIDRGLWAAYRATNARKRMVSHLRRGEREEGEAELRRVRALEENSDDALRLATRTYEAALALDATEPRVRRGLADVLFFRALLAERRILPRLREELVERLTLYDVDGTRRAAFLLPGMVALDGLVAGARVGLERYVRRGRHRTPVAVELGPGALRGLLPGAYRLTVRAPERVSWTLAFALGRGERLRVPYDAPRASKVPPGFVWVPGGRYVRGSRADDEARRGFFDAPYVHPDFTAGYLIGQHEVRFADYIAFLESLGAKEARRHTPGTAHDSGLTSGQVSLRRQPAGWVLSLAPADRTYRVRAGERLVFPGRTKRTSQDWLNFPVVGVSAEDAKAYADWLSSTGQVPDARLCTEAEWERAARGPDDRPFPHGDRLEPDDANFDATYDKRPDAMGLDEVGSHPASRSPYGVDDMVGNAFEWTTSSPRPGRYVLRGGSFFYDAKTSRIENRQVAVPTLRVSSVGFRICAPASEEDPPDGHARHP